MIKESCDFYNWLLKVLLKILVEGWVEVKTILTNNCTEKPHGKRNHPFNLSLIGFSQLPTETECLFTCLQTTKLNQGRMWLL